MVNVCPSDAHNIYTQTLKSLYSTAKSTLYDATPHIYRNNEEYFANYLQNKYTSLNYNPEKTLFENVKENLSKYVNGEIYLDKKALGDLTALYVMYKSGVMSKEDAQEVFEYLKPIYISYAEYISRSGDIHSVAHYSWISNGYKDKPIFGKIYVNNSVFEYLNRDEQLEVLFHEGIHALQSIYNPEILENTSLAEGEAVVYSEMWVRDFNPQYNTIVNDEYKRYKQIYLLENLYNYELLNTINKIKKDNETTHYTYYYLENKVVDE